MADSYLLDVMQLPPSANVLISAFMLMLVLLPRKTGKEEQDAAGQPISDGYGDHESTARGRGRERAEGGGRGRGSESGTIRECLATTREARIWILGTNTHWSLCGPPAWVA